MAAGAAADVTGAEVEVLDTPAAAMGLARRDRSVLALLPADVIDASVRVLSVGGVHPLRDPAAYPLTVPAQQQPAEVTTLTIVGDIMLGRRVGRSLPSDDAAAVFRPFAKRLASADITIGNFEATLSDDGSPTQGGDSFAADPSTLDGLRLAGFDAVSLANNHVGDYGRRAMLQTFEEFADAEIETFGAGRDLAAARKPLVINTGNTTVGFIGTESIGETSAATGSTPGTNRLNMPPRTGPMDTAALDRIAADIERLAQRVDTVVVVPHWGTQYTNVPEASQRRTARRFAAAGADLIIGGHPHWVQGWENIGGALVVHSLGNFIFDMDFSRQTQEGIFVEIVLWDGEVVAAEPVPYVIGSDFTPRPAGDRRAQMIMELMRETSRGSYALP